MTIPSDASKANCDSSADDPKQAILTDLADLIDSYNTLLAELRTRNLDAPTGTVAAFAGSSAPSGWLLCYGQAVSRTTYSALFAAISTTHGAGDGSTTFNLPDLRGRAVFGKDDMGGSAASRVTSGNSGIAGATLGAAGGDERLHQHNHSGATGTDSVDHTHVYNKPTGSAVAVTGGSQGFVTSSTSQATSGVSAFHTHSISNSGSGSSQNMPPSVILNYIIKT